jgi:hypothetical protein
MSEQSNSPPEAPPAAAPGGEQPSAAPALPRRWSTTETWTLGVFSVIGLVGFLATFVLIVMRSPNAPVERTLSPADIARLKGPSGERGPAGPAGPRGPAGDSGVRIVRTDCSAGNCTAECADDEVLLNAYCSPSRTPVAYPTEHSAACRPAPRGKVEVVAACVKARR